MPEREGGPSFPEKAVRYPLSLTLAAVSLIELFHLNVVVAGITGLLAWVSYPKSSKPQTA